MTIRNRPYFNLFVLTILFVGRSFLFAQVQDKVKLKLQNSVFLEERTGENSAMVPYLQFPNINNSAPFVEKSLKKRIQKADEEEDLLALDSLLSRFVHSWSIQNFVPDAEYVWKLGQVKEILGDTSAALLYYELAIKNLRPNQERVQIHYDSLIERTHNSWVDLQFYYKILEARREIDPLIPPKGVMLNMGKRINSERPDYAPYMHPSDSVLIFTSRRNEEIVIDIYEERKNEDLYFTLKDFVTGGWSIAEKFSDEINSEFNEGSSCLSRDGRTLFFTRCDEPNGLGSCDLYIAEYIGGEWQNIRNIGKNVNSSAWDSHPNITPDGKTLFFISNRDGGFGRSDIYYTTLIGDSVWSPAVNLGPEINTIEDEVTPFYHKVNQTLYFSSTGHLQNMGGYDIFKSRWLKDHWEAPKNVGPLVNSAGNEYYFSIDGQGKRLFYAKAKASDDRAQVQQNFDLYSFPMPMEARPDAIITLKGVLVDSITGYPLQGIVLVIDKQDGIEVAPKYINRFGYFEFDLISNKKYDIYVQGENFLTVEKDLYLRGDTSFAVFANSFETGKPLVFESLEFDDNSYEVSTNFEPQLDYLTSFLMRYPMFRLEIKGHTDSDGEARYNLDLSRKRSLMIRKYISKRGSLDGNRILAKGFGESMPLVPNDSEIHKKMNRRVEFEIWLDPNYKGDMLLPMGTELFFDDTEEFDDPEFTKDFDFDWEEEFLEENWDLEEGGEIDEELLREYEGILDMDPLEEDDDDDDDFSLDIKKPK